LTLGRFIVFHGEMGVGLVALDELDLGEVEIFHWRIRAELPPQGTTLSGRIILCDVQNKAFCSISNIARLAGIACCFFLFLAI